MLSMFLLLTQFRNRGIVRATPVLFVHQGYSTVSVTSSEKTIIFMELINIFISLSLSSIITSCNTLKKRKLILTCRQILPETVSRNETAL